MSIETPNFIAAPEVEPEEYYDPFVTNEDGTIDLNLNGNALVSGSLGIGTTNPTSKLQVAGNTTPSIDNQFDLGSSSLRWKNVYVGTIVGNLVGAASTVLIVDDTNTTGNPLRFINFSSTKSGISNIYADSLLTFNPTNNNLGIGTTNPGEKLQVDGNIRVGISTTSNYIAFRGTTSDGTNASGGGDQSVGLKRWEHTYIGERIYESGTEKSELLLFKGNDGAGEFGPDRVRVLAGEFRVDTHAGPSSGTFEQVGNALSNNALIVNDIGINVSGDVFISKNLKMGLTYNHTLGLGQTSGASNIGFTSTSALIWGAQNSSGITTTLTITCWHDNNAYIDNRNNGDLYFRTGNIVGSLDNIMVLKSDNGYLGIGTSSPASTLDVNGPIISRSGALVFSSVNTNSNFVDPTSVSATNVDHIWNTDTNPPASYGLTGTYHFVNDSTYKSDGNSAIRAGGFYNMDDTGTASQRLQISGGAYVSGNVGIGITNPTSKLHVSGTVIVTGTATFQSDVFLGDGDDLYFGDSNDLRIFHNGSNSYIDVTTGATGNLYIRNTRTGGDVFIQADNDAAQLRTVFAATGTASAAQLFYDGTKRFETTATGTVVTGIITATTGFVPDTDEGAYLGTALLPFSEAHIGEIRIADTNDNTIDTATGNLTLNSAGGTVSILDNLSVNGTLSKTGGSFVIDHPLNETKNLVHSFVEGPRADLIYRGTVSLIDGSATINLDEEYELIPGTWKALCRNPQVWISNIDGWTNCRGTVEDGILIIEAQTASNESVNWLVIAERQDKYMYDTEWTDDNGRPILEPLKTQ